MAQLRRKTGEAGKPATGKDVRDIVGPMDEALVSAILHTHATRHEIALAISWLEENHHTQSSFSRPMSDRVRRVYEILDYARNNFNGGARS